MMINKIVSLIKTEAITETNSVLQAAGNIVAEMVDYKNKEMNGNRQPNWWRRISTIKQNVTKGIKKWNYHIKAWKKIESKTERCWSGSWRSLTEVRCCWIKTWKIWQYDRAEQAELLIWIKPEEIVQQIETNTNRQCGTRCRGEWMFL